jgi:AraC-like DNA-binding protein
MIDRIFHPIPVLSDVVEYYLYYKIDPTQSAIQYYATPLMQGLVFNFGSKPQHHTFGGKTITLKTEAYLFGQTTCPRVVTEDHNGVEVLGVMFKPLGITKITGINMEHMADQIITADDIWGNKFEFLADEIQSAPSLEDAITVLENFLIEEYLRTNLKSRIDSTRYALSLITQKKGDIPIKLLQEKTNTTRKTLERSFMHTVGVHPKLYTRIVRFNAIKEYIDCNLCTENLTSLALDFGFYDSSHFSAEFKNFCGITPTEYLSNKKQLYFSTTIQS